MIYEKETYRIEDHIALLKKRGLIIEDELVAHNILKNISYYRLAGYWWSMQQDKINHLFKPNSKLLDVIELYNFDREFRILLFEVIEKIEISFRTKLIYHLSHEFDPWWFQNSTIFQNTHAFNKTISAIKEEVTRSKEIFIKEHIKKYKEDVRFPPAWKTLELTSFGTLSKIYGNLKNTIRSKDIIAEEFGAVNHTYLPSWLQSIVQIRNYCAHHSRLWNRNLPVSPKILNKPPHKWVYELPTNTQKIYAHLCIMRYVLNVIDPENTFALKLDELLKRYPSVDPKAMGFISDWKLEPLWSL